MNHCIIYLTVDGAVAIVTPADCGLTIQQIAAKDVPECQPFAIIDAADVPADREAREIWRAGAALALLA